MATIGAADTWGTLPLPPHICAEHQGSAGVWQGTPAGRASPASNIHPGCRDPSSGADIGNVRRRVTRRRSGTEVTSTAQTCKRRVRRDLAATRDMQGMILTRAVCQAANDADHSLGTPDSTSDLENL